MITLAAIITSSETDRIFTEMLRWLMKRILGALHDADFYIWVILWGLILGKGLLGLRSAICKGWKFLISQSSDLLSHYLASFHKVTEDLDCFILNHPHTVDVVHF